MITRHNIPVYKICWLNHADSGTIGTFYEPENTAELIDVCKLFYKENKQFDLIGHTSNIYFLPGYCVDYMVSTRKCVQFYETDNEIICDCGVPVMKLARKMVNKGVKGFEGLIDLPGTVAAAVYGNSSCFNSSITDLLVSFELLRPDGEISTLLPKDLRLSKRSSALKRKELIGTILSVRLKREIGNLDEIKKKSEFYQTIRKQTQPGPKDNLGTIYAKSGGWTLFSFIPRIIAKSYVLVTNLFVESKKSKENRQKEILLKLLGAGDLLPYVFNWKRYIWKDEKSHELFWKFHKIHKILFKQSIFEIEIKGNKL